MCVCMHICLCARLEEHSAQNLSAARSLRKSNHWFQSIVMKRFQISGSYMDTMYKSKPLATQLRQTHE